MEPRERTEITDSKSDPDVSEQIARPIVKVSLKLAGMTSATCAQTIENALKKVPGVSFASVNLATEKGRVTYDSTLTGLEKLKKAVEEKRLYGD